ncbi:MAG TPA: hypothetical protein VKR62_01050, partial [Roseiarcus sp.]|nr:hypothetical protein [Roseiarcus sp.]
ADCDLLERIQPLAEPLRTMAAILGARGRGQKDGRRGGENQRSQISPPKTSGLILDRFADRRRKIRLGPWSGKPDVFGRTPIGAACFRSEAAEGDRRGVDVGENLRRQSRTISCRKSEAMTDLPHDRSSSRQGRFHRSAAPADRERLEKFLSRKISRNPLKSLDSNERIQGNPSVSNPRIGAFQSENAPDQDNPNRTGRAAARRWEASDRPDINTKYVC